MYIWQIWGTGGINENNFFSGCDVSYILASVCDHMELMSSINVNMDTFPD